jgi:hypothetical protein
MRCDSAAEGERGPIELQRGDQRRESISIYETLTSISSTLPVPVPEPDSLPPSLSAVGTVRLVYSIGQPLGQTGYGRHCTPLN